MPQVQIDITQIILAFLSILGAVLSSFFIPWLKTKISLNNDKLSENQIILLRLVVATAVKAAEQLFSSNETEKKKAYVVELLESQGYKLDKGVIDAAVEAAVLDLHRELDV